MPGIDPAIPRPGAVDPVQRHATRATTPEQAQRIGVQFEQMFLSQMLAPMFEGLGTDGLFGGGSGERMFRSFQIDTYAQAITRRGGVGIAERVAREILSLQEKNHG